MVHFSKIHMCSMVLDRRCWLFLVQACISFLTVSICTVLLFHGVEVEWAKSILVMVVSVWFPAPSIITSENSKVDRAANVIELQSPNSAPSAFSPRRMRTDA